MVNILKRFFARLPGPTRLYLDFFLAFKKNFLQYPRSKKYYSLMPPRPYSSSHFCQSLAKARKIYRKWERQENEVRWQRIMKNYTHPYWQKTRGKIQKYFLNSLNENYLRNSFFQFNLGPDMVGITLSRVVKIKYLLDQDDFVKIMVKNYRDSRIGNPILEPASGLGFPVIGSSIDQLYYLAKIVRDLHCVGESCLELGGGYGGFYRIMRLYNPRVTYIMVDFPEVLATVYLYHVLNFPKIPIVIHESKKQQIQKSALNLIPVWSINEISYHPEVFISTFAVTETTDLLLNKLKKINFFKAKAIYIKGGKDNFFDSHIKIQKIIKELRNNVQILEDAEKYYEILAR